MVLDNLINPDSCSSIWDKIKQLILLSYFFKSISCEINSFINRRFAGQSVLSWVEFLIKIVNDQFFGCGSLEKTNSE